jgi:hypothetical protein
VLGVVVTGVAVEAPALAARESKRARRKKEQHWCVIRPRVTKLP